MSFSITRGLSRGGTRANFLTSFSSQLPSLLNKIAEMEELFDKPVKGRPTKGKDTGENDAKGLSRGNQKKVNEFMADLKGVMVSESLPAPSK